MTLSTDADANDDDDAEDDDADDDDDDDYGDIGPSIIEQAIEIRA